MRNPTYEWCEYLLLTQRGLLCLTLLLLQRSFLLQPLLLPYCRLHHHLVALNIT